MNTTPLPALFVGHGSPENLLLDNELTRALRACGTRLPRPRAILAISAHWLTRGTCVSSAAHPAQVHDFHGFPQALYQIAYRPLGDTALVKRLLELGSGRIRADAQAGLDHGTWTVLYHLFPQADIPVVQLSLDVSLSRAAHLHLAQQLAVLREEGVLIIGSGNIVHNLRQLDWQQPEGGTQWARRYDQRVRTSLLANDDAALLTPPAADDLDARLSVPSEDHFWPLLYVEGVRHNTDQRLWLNEGYEYGGIARRSYVLAAPGALG